MSTKNSSGQTLSLILVTYPADANYRAWCRSIIERNLAACVNIINVNSIYRWKETIEESQEVLLIFKTRREVVELLKEVIMKEHPYEVPEFIELQANNVNASYLKWIIESTTQQKNKHG
ncbi:MAG: divalent-cation tolerance protein CutA [Halobacteria archaeon]